MIVAVRLDSLFTMPGAKVTPLPFFYGSAFSHLPLESRFIASTMVQRSLTLTHAKSGALPLKWHCVWLFLKSAVYFSKMIDDIKK